MKNNIYRIEERYRINRMSDGMYEVRTTIGEEKDIGITECIRRSFLCSNLDAAFNNIRDVRRRDLKETTINKPEVKNDT
jgi:predicted transcriptional regulator of viral defense system